MVPANVIELAQRVVNRASGTFKLAAIIYDHRSGRVISTGWNQWGFDFRNGLHAEEHALIRAKPIKGNRVAVYVYRQGHKLAKPCESCQRQLDNAGIRFVSWSGT